MYIFKLIGNFFLSAWIWNITFDWFHPVITGCIMFLVLRFILCRKTLRAILISFTAQVFALGMLTGTAIGLSELLQWQYDPLNSKVALAAMNTLYASLSLGLVYTIFHAIYFAIGYLIWRYNLSAFLVMTVLSNSLAFALSYMFIRMAKVWYYVA